MVPTGFKNQPWTNVGLSKLSEWRHSGHIHLLYTVYVHNKPLRLVSDFSVQQSKGERKKYSSSSRFSPITGNVVKTKVWWVSAQKAAQIRGCRPEQTGNWCWEVLSNRRVTRERINMQLWHQVVEPPPPPCFSSVWITAAALQTQQTRSHPVQDRIKKQGKRQRLSGTSSSETWSKEQRGGQTMLDTTFPTMQLNSSKLKIWSEASLSTGNVYRWAVSCAQLCWFNSARIPADSALRL